MGDGQAEAGGKLIGICSSDDLSHSGERVPWPFLWLSLRGADADDDALNLLLALLVQAGADGLHPDLVRRLAHGLGDGVEAIVARPVAVDGGGAVAVDEVGAHDAGPDAGLVHVQEAILLFVLLGGPIQPA